MKRVKEEIHTEVCGHVSLPEIQLLRETRKIVSDDMEKYMCETLETYTSRCAINSFNRAK